MKFLIIDDDEDIREILTVLVVSHYDVSTTAATDGNDAIAKIQNDGPFDLVICDYNMPKQNGSEVYNELRKQSPQTPFILVSTDFEKFKRLHPDATLCDFIEKPFDETEITTKIERLISRRDLPFQKDSYIPVSLDALDKIGVAGVPLYLKLNQNQYVKVLRDTMPFDKVESARFRAKKLESLYIELIDIKIFLENFRKSVFSNIDWKEVDTSVAIDHLSQDWNVILEGARSFGWPESLTVMAKENILRTLSLIGSNPQLKKVFERLNLAESKSKAPPHCYTLVFLTTAIAKELGWDSDLTLQKLTFASLLHEMDLNDVMFANKLDLINNNKLVAEISHQTNYPIFNHMNTAADFVSRWSSCPPDVDKLIRQHHERFDGTGFPAKLNFLTLFPLAGLFIMAEDVIYFNLNHPKESAAHYLQRNEAYYNRGDFKRVFSACLNVVTRLEADAATSR